jgi:multidrug efflux pump subunit AcrA (membrane-fusion protein)
MTWLQRARPALFVLGALLLVGSLLGARALTKANGQGNGEQPKTANPAPTAKLSGPIVLGTVDSDPSPVPYLLPPVLQSGTVTKVFVKTGQEVKVNQPLYEFDTSLQKADYESAKAAVAMANTKVDVALEGAKAHAKKIELAEQAVLFAGEKKKMLGDTYNLIKNNLETFWKGQKGPNAQPYSEGEIAKKLADDDKLLKAHAEYVFADRDVIVKEKELAALRAADPQVYVREAQAGVEQARAAENKAQIAINLCTVKAGTAGTIERITIGEGSTLGVGTREYALWLIPAGSRIVRAEVEADFAHRVGKDLEGKEVVVFDNTDPRLTYRGKVLTVGGTFLPKRSGNQSLLGSDTSVLEAVIEILDPAPPGKPPLRVGQRVRVGLGQ